MSLRYAILGVLRNQDLHGYAVRRSLGSLLAGFWPVNQGQVYTTLRRLHRENLVRTSKTSGTHPAAGRRTYSLTNQGENVLQIWLDASAGASIGHRSGFDDWLGHLAICVHRGHREQIARAIRVQRQRCQGLLSLGLPEPTENTPPVLRVSRAIVLAELAWLERAQRELLAEKPSGAAHPS